MPIRYEEIHSANLNNTCPRCYSGNVKVHFEQAIKETLLFTKAKKDIKGAVLCKNCEEAVFPVDWDEDLERVYDYHRKLAETKMLQIGYALKKKKKKE